MKLHERVGQKMLSKIKTYLKQPTRVDLQDVFKPLYVILALLGLFPCNVKYNKTKQEYSVVKKSVYLNSVIAICIVLILYGFTALHVQDIKLSGGHSSLTDALVLQMNYIIELILLMIVCSSAYIFAFINRFRYIRILNSIASVWLQLPGTKSDEILQLLRFKTTYITISFLIFLLILQLCVNSTRSDPTWKVILVLITFNLPQMIQFSMIVFYTCLVLMTVSILTHIIAEIEKLAQHKSYCKYITVESKCNVTLRQMELIYMKAFEVKKDINQAFQAPILLSTVQCLHSIVCETHTIYHGVVVQWSITTHEIVNCSIWALYQLIKIYVLSYSGSVLKSEVLKVGQALHNIPTEKQDLILMSEIQHFSSLMSYQVSDITVYGFFPLDATLMFNIIASATMYLIIFVQFDKEIKI